MRRSLVKPTIIALLLTAGALLQGCSDHDPITKSAPVSEPAPSGGAIPISPPAESVRFAYMSPPIPMAEEPRPLYGDRDGERIGQLLEWLAQAEPIEGTGLSGPLMERSWAAVIEYENGNTREIRPAWRCIGLTDAQGNTGSTCTTEPNDIAVSEPDGRTWFAESEPLFRFFTDTYKDWLPAVKPYVVPETIRLGEPFSVEGRGWLTDRVVVEIAKAGLVVWRGDAKADHGDFAMNGLLYRGVVEPGTYDVTVKGDNSGLGRGTMHERSYGLSITVSG